MIYMFQHSLLLVLFWGFSHIYYEWFFILFLLNQEICDATKVSLKVKYLHPILPILNILL